MASERNVTLLSCRYCLTNTKKHNEKFFFSDKLNKYEKILEDTFNIQICFSNNKYLCMDCRKNIRNAAAVKKKVLNVQKILLEQSKKMIFLDTETVKKESSSDCDECFDIGDIGPGEGEGEDNGPGQVEMGENEPGQGDIGESGPGQGEIGENGPGKNEMGDTEISYTKAKADKTFKVEKMESEKGVLRRKTSVKALMTDKTNQKNKVEKKRKEAQVGGKGKRKPTKEDKRLLEKKKNTLILLENSNMCLFISKKVKYACFSCGTNFLDMQTLRIHSKTHNTDKIQQSIKQTKGLTFKTVDISNLECKNCSQKCKDINELRVHLKSNHSAPFEGTEHLLLPYRIEDGFDCVFCQQHCSSFKQLSIHMNCHSSGNVCEKCGMSFNSRTGLRNHLANVHTEKRCTLCPATFPTLFTRMRHMKTVHNKGILKRYCTRCDMTFKYGYSLTQHMINEHGVKQSDNVCQYCKKVFTLAASVRSHIKNVHLKVKKYACNICGMLFCTTNDQRRHEMTHGTEKRFSCRFCDVKFKSKDSMQRHLKRKHGEYKIG